jgi:hypothetical protein
MLLLNERNPQLIVTDQPLLHHEFAYAKFTTLLSHC